MHQSWPHRANYSFLQKKSTHLKDIFHMICNICRISNFPTFYLPPLHSISHSEPPLLPRFWTLSPVSSSPPGSPSGSPSPQCSGCTGPGSPPPLSGSEVPKPEHLPPPPPPPLGSRGDGGMVPGLLGDGWARWCAGAAERLLWTGRWRTRTEGAPCRRKRGGSASESYQTFIWI